MQRKLPMIAGTIARRAWSAALFAGVLVLAAGPTLGQDNAPNANAPAANNGGAAANYKAPLDFTQPQWVGDEPAKRRNRSEIERTIRNVVTGQAPLDANRQQIENYFFGYFFVRMTHPEHFGTLAQDRVELLERYLRPSQGAVHDFLIDLAFRATRALASENYRPETRYTAMLIIGELNSREPVTTGTNKSPAAPYGPALPVLISGFEDASQPDVVRLAALVGILRHAQLDPFNQGSRMDNATRSRIQQQMLAVVQSAPPQNRSPEAHAWFQRRAIDVLAALRSPGANGEVAQALASTVASQQAPVAVRLAAAQALGQLNLASGAAIPATDTALHVGAAAALAARQDLEWLEKQKNLAEIKTRLQSGGAGGGLGGGMLGGGDMGPYGGGGGGNPLGDPGAGGLGGAGMGGPAGMGAPGLGMGGPGGGMGGPGGGMGGPYGGGMGGPGGGMGGPYGGGGGGASPGGASADGVADYKLLGVRRLLKQHMTMALMGLGAANGNSGLLALEQDANKKTEIAGVRDAVNQLSAVADQEDLDSTAMIGEIRSKLQALETLVQSVAPQSEEEDLPLTDLPQAAE